MSDQGTPERADGARLWAVVGATGTGKTDLSLRLAQTLAARGRPAGRLIQKRHGPPVLPAGRENRIIRSVRP